MTTWYVRPTLLHLGDEILVEQTPGLLMQWAVDCDDIALTQHLLKILNSPAANFLLNLGLQWLVVEVEQLLAVKRLQSTEHTLANAANSHCADNLVFEVILVLCNSSHVPFAALDLLMGWNEVSDEKEDGHDDVLGYRDDVGAGDFGNGDTTISLVGSIQIDVVRPNTGCDSNL